MGCVKTFIRGGTLCNDLDWIGCEFGLCRVMWPNKAVMRSPFVQYLNKAAEVCFSVLSFTEKMNLFRQHLVITRVEEGDQDESMHIYNQVSL